MVKILSNSQSCAKSEKMRKINKFSSESIFYELVKRFEEYEILCRQDVVRESRCDEVSWWNLVLTIQKFKCFIFNIFFEANSATCLFLSLEFIFQREFHKRHTYTPRTLSLYVGTMNDIVTGKEQKMSMLSDMSILIISCI